MDNFSAFGFPEALMHKLEHLKFEQPTPIQTEAIPVALAGGDILASAQTGTGKTAAFALPLIVKLMNEAEAQGLIITPTRELAVQVMQALKSFLGKQTKLKSVLLIGGEPIAKQLRILKSQPRFIVGTPGRINDHLKRQSLNLEKINYLVLDETDRMLDMGFTVQIEDIIKHIKVKRQTLLFSATIPKNIKNMAGKYLEDPTHITVGKNCTPALNISQENINIAAADKYLELVKQVDKREGSIIVFVNTKHGAEKLAYKLKKEKHDADTIHGDLRHHKRERVIANFRKGSFRVLVATDVVARGIDIPHIKHIINYDLPQCPEDYIHRIGRTGRAEASGSALNFISKSDQSKWYLIQKLLNPEADNNKSSNKDNNKNSRQKKKPKNKLKSIFTRKNSKPRNEKQKPRKAKNSQAKKRSSQ